MIPIAQVKSAILTYLQWSLEDNGRDVPKEAIGRITDFMEQQLDIRVPDQIEQDELLKIVANIVKEFNQTNPGVIAKSDLLNSLKYILGFLMPTIVNMDAKIERVWDSD